MTTTEGTLLTLPAPERGLIRKAVFSLAGPPFKKIVRLRTLNSIYSRVRETQGSSRETSSLDFASMILKELKLTYRCEDRELSNIPESGPVIVVCNHPFGGMEGLVLAELLHKRRPDVKIMANYMLSYLPELKDLFFFVDPFGQKESVRNNLGSLRKSLSWVKRGGVLGLFPAGEVSSLNVKKRSVVDPEWTDQLARIVRVTEAHVVPMHFSGCNGPFFQLAGLVHPMLRTILLPRELLNKQNRTVFIKVGSAIRPSQIRSFESDRDLVSYLRLKTYNLKYHKDHDPPHNESSRRGVSPSNPLLNSVGRCEKCRKEVESLPEKKHLASQGDFTVYLADSWEIPHLLAEIGIGREETFRAVGEGTGREKDLDVYDNYYRHLVLWDRKAERLAGAYRLGETDTILEKYGLKGLYTCSLFSIKKGFFRNVGPALELGRSFVRAEYQKTYTPLMLLWKGIGAFVAENPHYRTLFGPVSISSRYSKTSRKYMVEYIRKNYQNQDMKKHVKPKTPPRFKKGLGRDVLEHFRAVKSVDDLSGLIRDIDPGFEGIPVLLKHYLKIGGSMVSFNVDHYFNDALDGLIVVDLIRVDEHILNRFMGRERAKVYRALQSGSRRAGMG